jgi:hypothetical protein
MAKYPAWLDEKASHAADLYKRVIIEDTYMTVTLCGRLMTAEECRTENVHWFGKYETTIKKTECEGCKDEARIRLGVGVAHRDYHAVGDADSLSETA